MIALAIAICEVMFWVLVLGGLTLRYALGRPQPGAIVLMGVPLVDVALCVVTAIDLANGVEADWTHGLAALYVGFSVAFGPALIATMDRHFARRSRRAQRPRRLPVEDRLWREWRLWARCVVGCAVASGVLGALVLVAGDVEQTRAIWVGGGWFVSLGALCAVWLLLGPVLTGASRLIRNAPEGSS